MDLMQRRRALMMGQKPIGRLPREYQEVEWLRSDGEQYIDTQYTGFDQDHSIEIGYAAHSYRCCVFGYQSSGVGSTINSNTDKASNTRWGNDYYRSDFAVSNEAVNKFHKVSLSKNGLIYDDKILWIPAANNFMCGSLYLFRANGAGTLEPSSVKNALIVNGSGNAVRNMVQCYRKSDGKPGAYDMCGSICPLTNSPFYINAGTGEFLVGPEV